MSRSYYRTRIKFCGMTRAGDVRLAGELGVDAVGFIFARESSRRVAPAEARAMRQAIAPMVDVVALFRNNSKEEVREVLRTVRPTLLQFHGEEDESFCRSFNMPYLKAIAMGGREDVNARTLQLRYPSAAGFLFDSHAPGGGGGTGVAFDWTRLPTGLHRRIACERLFLDAFNGNHTLFVRDDEVRAAWAWIDSVADAWKDAKLPLEPYPAGQWGPGNAGGFLPQDLDAPDSGASA